MARKYIKQIDNQSFVYPNNDLAEYDIEIVHDLKENSVTGSVTNFVAVFSGSAVNVSFDYTWNLNGAEPFIREDGTMTLFSVHMMEPSLTFYKPWNTIGYVTDSTVTDTTKTGHFMVNVYPSQFNLSSFLNGQYNYEIRFVGHREVIPVSINTAITNVSPTPTPTPTNQTPTPTPTNHTPTPTPTNTQTPTPTSTVIPIGTGGVVGATECTITSATPTLYLDLTDYAKYTANGGCLSDGGLNTISVIRDVNGNPITGTFYFVWYGSSCSETTFKSTNGNITTRPTQC